MKIPTFVVLLDQGEDQDPTEHIVEIRHGDQLRAELEGPKHGLNDMSAAPLHFTTLWVWAAMTRTEVITDKFQVFKGRVLTIDAREVATEAGPTSPGRGTTSP